MAATITGIVYNDLNLNGQHDVGEPGIPNVNVVLSGTSGCTTTQTDANGNYSFSATAGTYTIYEPVETPNGCPPTEFSQPDGFNVSNGPRKLSITVTTAQSNNGATLSGNNFSHALNPNSLTCDAIMIQFAGVPTIRYNIDIVTGESVPQGPLSPSHYVNAIGESPLDSFIYGYDQTTHNVVRIDSNNVITTLLPNPPGLPSSDFTTGCFDENGFFYLYAVNAARYYTIDLRPNSATFMKLVNPTAGYVEQTSNYGVALSTAIDVSDWAINPKDGNLYGVNRVGNVVRVVPTSGAVTTLTTTGPKEAAETSYGACAFDFNGNLYVIANMSGVIRKYTITGNTANGALFSQSAASSNNDGTMCFFATIDVDYGDAPDTGTGNGPDNYNTLLQNDGPRHGLINDLLLGTKVTAESDAYQNADATGDDIPHGIQDDGLVVPLTPLSQSGGIYVLNVTVTNETNQTANLYGWIDFNENGLFESSEAAPVALVPSMAGTQSIPLTFTVPSGLSAGHTFVRLRLTTNDLTNTGGAQDTRSVGSASDGEVEDYIISISESADLSVVKTGSPKPVTAGDQLTYTIFVNNAGPDTAVNTILTDTIPAELLNPEYSLDGGITWNPWTGTLALGDLAMNDMVTILIRGTVSSSAVELIENTAVVSSDTFDPNLDNNTSTDTTEVVGSADLAVSKVGAPKPVMTGELLTYTIIVNNFGPSDAQNSVLTDVVPPELENPEFSIDGGITYNPWTGILVLGTIPSGEEITILLRGTVGAEASGTITNTVTISSSTPDPNPDNNHDTDITPINNSADLSVTKIGSPKPVLNGGQLVYGINVTNNGPDTAINTILTDPIPPELTNVEYSIDGGTTWLPWTGNLVLGNLAPNTSVQIFIRGTVSALANGTIENTVTVSSDTPDPNPDNNTDTDITPVNESADLCILKSASPIPVFAGEVLTYTIEIYNAGSDAAVNTILTDVIPSEIENPEYSVNGSSTFLPWTGSYNAGTIPAGDTVTVTIRGTVASDTPNGTIISNTAVVSSDTPDPNPDNNTDDIDVPVEVSADLAITKVANSATAVPGELITYTITVSNLGPSDAEAVVLIDAVSANILNPEFSIDGGLTWNSWLSPYSLGILAAGTSRVILLRGIVNPSATGSILNTGTVTSSTPDPNPDNNTDTDETPIEELADISVIKTASPNPVATGFKVVYTLLIQNFGPATSENVLLTDFLPAGTTDGEFSLDNGASWSPWSGTYLVGDMVNGASTTILLRATVSDDAESPLSNTAVVSSDTTDPNPDNNTSTADVDVELSADLSIVKTAEPDPVRRNETLTYTLNIKNFGPGTAENVIVADNVSTDLNNVEFSTDGGVTWFPWVSPYSVGDLASGEERTILIRGVVSADAGERILNSATISSDTPDPNPDNNTSDTETCVCEGVVPETEADLSVTKTALQNSVLPGSQINYTINVQNNGPDTAVNVYLFDNVPSSILNPEYSLDGGATWHTYVNPIFLGNIDANDVVTVLIRGQVSPTATGTIENTAVVTSDTPDPNPDNNSSTSQVPISPNADLGIIKTPLPSVVAHCDTLFFVLTVTNYGPNSVENVLVTDNVPFGYKNVQFSLDQGNTWNPWNGSLNIGTMAPNTTRIIILKGIVGCCARNSIKNIAQVSSTPIDLNLSNNTALVSVPIVNRNCRCKIF